MKRIVPLLALVACFMFSKAQCTIDLSIVAWGFHPDTGTVLKHACAGSQYDEVIQIFAPQTVTVQLGTFPVNYVQLDSMQGLPGSLTYSTNPLSGYMAGGDRGCINIYGLADAPTGLYNFTIYYTANFTVFGTPASFPFTAPYKIQVDSGVVTFAEYSDTACLNSPYFFNSQWLTQSGNYNDTLANAAGCDSVVTLHLSVVDFDTTVTVSHDTLFAPAGYENYKLINCNTGDIISDGVENTLVGPIGCCFAMVISNHGCIDTSQCFETTAVSTGILKTQVEKLKLYPTVVNNLVNVEITDKTGGTIVVYNQSGAVVLQKQLNAGKQAVDVEALDEGLYVVVLNSTDMVQTARFVKVAAQ